MLELLCVAMNRFWTLNWTAIPCFVLYPSSRKVWILGIGIASPHAPELNRRQRFPVCPRVTCRVSIYRRLSSLFLLFSFFAGYVILLRSLVPKFPLTLRGLENTFCQRHLTRIFDGRHEEQSFNPPPV